MKKLIGFMLLVLALAMLSACGDAGNMVVTSLAGQGETAVKLSGDIRDASVQKELVVHQTLQNRDTLIAKSAKNAGVKFEFAIQEVTPGVFVQVMKSFEYHPEARFNQPLPMAPSVHPVWGAVDTGIKALLTGFGIYAATDLVKYSYDRTAPAYSYGGDYTYQSNNPATTTYLPVQ